MAIAGRVAIVPKGEWSQDVTYDKLDLVTHNGNTFIAYKSSVGIEPVDGDTWMLVMQGIDPQDIENIIDGTTPVGNANQLGGKGASEYFTKDGGTINGDVTVKSDSATARGLAVQNSLRKVSNHIDADGIYRLLDVTNGGKAIIHSEADGTNTFNGTASGNLPLSGGKIHSTSTSPLEVSGPTSNCQIAFYNGGVQSGGLGFSGKDKPTVTNSAWNKMYELLHTGNKPTGTYTGNGSATSRTVSVGGVSTALMIKNSGYGLAFVNEYGAILMAIGGSITSLSSAECKFKDGVLTIKTSNNIVNANGSGYDYHSL